MSTNSETIETIKAYLSESYTNSDATAVPKKHDLTFGNTVKKIRHAVILYIDMRKSRKIMFDTTNFWSIKIHKAFLRSVTHCIEKREGHFRSFNGDGLLSFFVGENAASRAVRAAMEIKGFVLKLNEFLKEKNINAVDFGIGIAQGSVMVAKSGKAGDDHTKQDLIWIGVPVYVAVELSEFGESPKNIWISDNVRTSIGKERYLDVINDKDGNSMWTKYIKKLASTNSDHHVRATGWYFNV